MQDPHLSALIAKHEGLERRLKEELSRPAPDAVRVQELKKQKLQIKQEIALH